MNVDTCGARERAGQWDRFVRRCVACSRPLAVMLAAWFGLVACGKLEWPESVFTLAPGPLPSWCRAHERLCDEAERIDIAFYQGRVEFEVQARAGGRTIVQGVQDDVYWKAGASMIDYPRAIRIRVGDAYDFYVLERGEPVLHLVDEATVRSRFDVERR